jgi:hypothetical protein
LFKKLFVDKDTVMNALQTSQDLHVLKNRLEENEIKRNRKRAMDFRD